MLTWEGLRRLANDLLGRKPYDGRDPLADADRNTTLAKALKAEGYIVLSPAGHGADPPGLVLELSLMPGAQGSVAGLSPADRVGPAGTGAPSAGTGPWAAWRTWISMCGDERAQGRVVVKMLNTCRCDWPWRERIVTLDDIRAILGRLAMDEDEVTEWLGNRGQRVSIMDALMDSGYVYLDPHSAQESYGPLCRSCEREVSPAELGWVDVPGESDCARCGNPIPGSSRGVSIYVW